MHNHKPSERGNPLIPSNPEVPLTLEGSFLLHQMMRIRWADWKALSDSERAVIAREAAEALIGMEQSEGRPSGVFSLLGHKGDLLFVHFRNSFEELNAAELRLAGLRLWDYLEPYTSYVSIVELGIYESSVKLYKSLAEKGVQPGDKEWVETIEETLERQQQAMAPRLTPEMPDFRYICFYPMDRKRGEDKNWYTVPIEERQRMMADHGKVGRKYAGTVKQIISGSIGFDDWEWGVDLFADDPVVFKKLIYEMRFDEGSAIYAIFGPFYTGIRLPAGQLGEFLEGRVASS
jgi:peroxiredoxin